MFVYLFIFLALTDDCSFFFLFRFASLLFSAFIPYSLSYVFVFDIPLKIHETYFSSHFDFFPFCFSFYRFRSFFTSQTEHHSEGILYRLKWLTVEQLEQFVILPPPGVRPPASFKIDCRRWEVNVKEKTKHEAPKKNTVQTSTRRLCVCVCVWG